MKIAYFDCYAGVSGDMFIGALIDAGLDMDALVAGLGKLPVSGYHVDVERVNKRGIQAVQFKVMLETSGGARLADSEFQEVASAVPGVPGAAVSADSEHAHRTLSEITALIQDSSLSTWVKTTACRIFQRLAEAEGQVHGMPAEQVHFHEVGGVDAIVDVVGAALGLEQLGIQGVYASPLHLGSGFVRSQHGILPVPAPATALLVRDVPCYTSEVQGELVTPTGAAVLTTLARGFGPMPPMVLKEIGYGAGRREREFPNALRVFVGEQLQESAPRRVRDPFPEQHAAPVGPAGYHEGPAVVIEANIDDMNPQLCEHLGERLLEGGALDVLWLPAQMKKGRPGGLLHVLASPEGLDDLLAILFSESTSIGARTYPVTKRMLQRQTMTVETPYGALRVKVARLGEQVVNIAPEYEDCRQLARQSGAPLKAVMAAALIAAGLALDKASQ